MTANANPIGGLGDVKPVSREILAERRRNDRAARPALEPKPMTPGQKAARERARVAARIRILRAKRARDESAT